MGGGGGGNGDKGRHWGGGVRLGRGQRGAMRRSLASEVSQDHAYCISIKLHLTSLVESVGAWNNAIISPDLCNNNIWG